MPRARCFWFLVGLAAVLLTAPTHATMQLERNVVYFQPGDPDRQDVVVRNPDAETLYLDIEVFEVFRPGELDEERVRIRDPRNMDLLVTPNKLAIPAGGQQRLRFVHLGERIDQEKVFRVNVTPKIGELQARGSGIKVLVAFQVLVIVAATTEDGTPVDPVPELYIPVEEIFDAIQSAIDARAATINATYHPSGYPQDVFIDRVLMIADEEIGYTIDSLTLR